MTKKIILGAMLCIAAISAFVACDKKDKEDVVDEITIYGTVVDADNGDPIQNAQISLYKEYFDEEQQKEDMKNGGTPGLITSTVTGSDGTYEFTISDVDRKFFYYLQATKKGFEIGGLELSLSNTKSGGRLKCDFHLTPSGQNNNK